MCVDVQKGRERGVRIGAGENERLSECECNEVKRAMISICV